MALILQLLRTNSAQGNERSRGEIFIIAAKGYFFAAFTFVYDSLIYLKDLERERQRNFSFISSLPRWPQCPSRSQQAELRPVRSHGWQPPSAASPKLLALSYIKSGAAGR